MQGLPQARNRTSCNITTALMTDNLRQGRAFGMQGTATLMTDYFGCPLRLGVSSRGPKPMGVRGAFRLRFPQRFGPLVKGLVGGEVVWKEVGTFICLRIEAARRLRAAADYRASAPAGASPQGPVANDGRRVMKGLVGPKRLKHEVWRRWAREPPPSSGLAN